MKILIEIFRGCLSAVKTPAPAEVTVLDRDNLTESCSVSTFLPTQASEAEIDVLVAEALTETDAAARAREAQETAQQPDSPRKD